LAFAGAAFFTAALGFAVVFVVAFLLFDVLAVAFLEVAGLAFTEAFLAAVAFLGALLAFVAVTFAVVVFFAAAAFALVFFFAVVAALVTLPAAFFDAEAAFAVDFFAVAFFAVAAALACFVAFFSVFVALAIAVIPPQNVRASIAHARVIGVCSHAREDLPTPLAFASLCKCHAHVHSTTIESCDYIVRRKRFVNNFSLACDENFGEGVAMAFQQVAPLVGFWEERNGSFQRLSDCALDLTRVLQGSQHFAPHRKELFPLLAELRLIPLRLGFEECLEMNTLAALSQVRERFVRGEH
jgi:hypothetical protein